MTGQARHIKKADIKGGKLSYGQRIELGQILFDDKLAPYEKYIKTMECLHEGWPHTFTVWWCLYYKEVIQGIQFWIKQEERLLRYDPTPEELAAGIKSLSDKLGHMSTVMALAKSFAKDPDEILKWEYGKVFGILYSDFESFKFQRKHQDVLDKKAEAKRKQRTGRR